MNSLDSPLSPLEHREWASKQGEVRICVSDAHDQGSQAEHEQEILVGRQTPQLPDAVPSPSVESADAATHTELIKIHVVAGGSVVSPPYARSSAAQPVTTTNSSTAPEKLLCHPVTVSRGSSSSSSFRAIATEMETKPSAMWEKDSGKAWQQQPPSHGLLVVKPTSPIATSLVSTGPVVGPGKQADGDDDDSDEKVCRVCQLSLYQGNDAMELGCACKEDLALVHRRCALEWFKIKGNLTCEVCGKAVLNLPELNSVSVTGPRAAVARDGDRSSTEPVTVSAELRWWQQQPVRNFLLTCALIAFMLPWLFRFFSS